MLDLSVILFMIGHSLGRMETCFGWYPQHPMLLGSDSKTHLKSRCCLHIILIYNV